MSRHAPRKAENTPKTAVEAPAGGGKSDKERAKAEAEEAQKKLSQGAACKAAMEYLAASCDSYKKTNNTYPLTMDDLGKADSHAAEIVGDATMWVQYGAPEIDPFFDKRFTLSASCLDGMKYSYDSETAQVTSTR